MNTILSKIIDISSEGAKMRFVTVSDLKQRATQIVTEIMATREEVVITKNGRPVVLLRTVEEKEFALASKEKKGGRKRGKR